MKYKDGKVDEKMEAAMTLEDCIDEIIRENFKKGDCFDSHAVINELLKNANYHKAYLDEFPKNCNVAQYHGYIAQKIGDSGLVEKVMKDSTELKLKTHTIYGELSENQVWQVK